MTPALIESQETRELARSFLRRTGMSPQDFARRIGYHYTTLDQFLRGAYRRGPNSKEASICKAITDFIGSDAAAVVNHTPAKLYEIGNVRTMRETFRQACDSACILLVYAPPGAGKTETARTLAPEYSSHDVEVLRVYCRAGIGPRDLMRRIAAACGSIANINIERAIANLAYDFAGRRAVLILDEAQHLSIECLEIVRELYDELHWSLILTGSHQLDRIFTKWAGDLEQLERRVTDKIVLPAVTVEEADGIVRSEIPTLTTAKVRALVDRSHVDIRSGDGKQNFLSIGRLMANIRAFQSLHAEASEPDVEAEKVEAIA